MNESSIIQQKMLESRKKFIIIKHEIDTEEGRNSISLQIIQ